MDTFDCGMCRSPGQNRSATPQEAESFWGAKGVGGAAPEGMEVRALIRCSARIDLPNRDVCACETAWVRNAPDEEWRPIVRLPRDFVASVSG
jgi:hypothetical protein